MASSKLIRLFLLTAFCIVLIGVCGSRTIAQDGVDKGCSPTVANPCTSGGSGGSSGSGGRTFLDDIGCAIFGGADCPAKPDTRRASGVDLHNKGVEAYDRGDYAAAVRYFEQALKYLPDSEKVKGHLADARARLAEQREAERLAREAEQKRRQAANDEAIRRSRAIADNMQNSAQDFAKTLNATSSSDGLDFDDLKDVPAGTRLSSNSIKDPADPCKQKSDGLTFGDPNVVDTRCAKQPLPRILDGDLNVHIDDAITSVYKDAAAGVEERVRKAFQAIADNSLKDSEKWPLAELWLKDALKLDAGSKYLKNLLDDVTRSKTGPKIVLPDPKGLGLRPEDAATKLTPDKWTTYYVQNEEGNLVRVPDKINYGALKAYAGLIKSVSAYAPKWVERPTYIIGLNDLLIRVPRDYDPLKPTVLNPGYEAFINPTSPLISIVDGGQIIIIPFAYEIGRLPSDDPASVKARGVLNETLEKPKKP